MARHTLRRHWIVAIAVGLAVIAGPSSAARASVIQVFAVAGSDGCGFTSGSLLSLDCQASDAPDSAAAAVDLSTGTLDARAVSGSSAMAEAILVESLTFFGVTSATELTFGARLTGSLSMPSPESFAWAFFGLNVGGLQPSTAVRVFENSGFFDETVFVQGTIDAGSIFSGSAVLEIDADLWVRAELGGSADFSGTASLFIELPPGVTFTSSSGVFLTEVGAIPEPATLTLFAAGLAGLGFMMRRRRRSMQLEAA